MPSPLHVMSPATNPISVSISGYIQFDGRFFPCSVQRDKKCRFQFKNLPVHWASKGSTSFVCSVNSSNSRRNPDFSRQNRHGFSRNKSRQNEERERESTDYLEDSEIFDSKNGPLLSGSGSPKFQATATPGPREKEIVNLFRKVQAQLRERAAIKEEKKIDNSSQGQSKQNETVDSLLKLLRKHSLQQGKRNNDSNRDHINSRSRSDANLDQPEQTGPLFEDKDPTFLNSNNAVKQDARDIKAPSVSRPGSNFQRRSPVPQVKVQPIYANGVVKRRENRIRAEQEPKFDFKIGIGPDTAPKTEGRPYYSGGDVFEEISEDETSEIDVGDDEDDGLEADDHIESSNLNAMKLAELRELAKSRGLKGFSKLKKQELIELLTVG